MNEKNYFQNEEDIMSIQDAVSETEEIKKITHSPKILRFRKSERMVHWAIAIPFLTCYTTAIILVFFYNPHPLRPYRDLFSWIHRISGICLFILPMLTILKSRHDYKVYFNNIKQAWVWTVEDMKWLVLMGLAAMSSRYTLPEQGKFNAAEKLNFMTLMSTYPLYIITGSFMLLTRGALLSWLIHFGMALIASPLLFGHLFMATVNPKTRLGLSGMISGFVDRHWAKHHYAKWYRENYESTPVIADVSCEITTPVRENYFNHDAGEYALQPVEVVHAEEFENEHETTTIQ
jgi:formate dehydrogenase subunit gamma